MAMMEDYDMEKHDLAVAAMGERVKGFVDAGVAFRIYHGDTNSTRLSNRKADAVLDISHLNHVVSIDEVRRVAVVEPNVSMDALVGATLKHGLIPQVVPEFPAITVGGAFSGVAAESSSFKFGYFGQSVNWAEFVLANGNIVKASAKDNSDLFQGASGACGTLGVGTLFEIELVEARRFVEVRYIPVHSMTDALEKLKNYTDNLCFVNFVEAILFSPTSGVIIVGTLTDEAKKCLPIVRFTRSKDPWFYLHAHESIAHARHTECDTCAYSKARNPRAKGTVVELVPITDYLFRYDRGAFWMGIYGQKPQLFNRMTRIIIDPLVRTRAMYKMMHHSGRSQSFIVQDLALPQQSADKFLAWADERLHIYPIWLCPIKNDGKAPLHVADGLASSTQSIINIGLWGLKTASWPFYENHIGPSAFKRFVNDNREIENKVRQLGGLKWLYAHNYYTEAEFWRIYDKAKYDELRQKYGAERLPNLWDKMGRDEAEYVEKKPFWKAVVLTMLGRDHLLN